MIKAGFLIILFLSPSVAKSFHASYEQTSAIATEKQAHHDYDDCPICQFHYTSFLEVESLQLNLTPLYLSFEQLFKDEREYFLPLFSYFLRAPPL
jgi:hypothetical protein